MSQKMPQNTPTEAVVESGVEKEAEVEAEEESYLAVDTGTENFGGLSRFTQLSKADPHRCLRKIAPSKKRE